MANTITVCNGINNVISFTVECSGEKKRSYHVTTISDTKHITEDVTRKHYGYETSPAAGVGTGWDVKGVQMKIIEKGQRGNCFTLDEMP